LQIFEYWLPVLVDEEADAEPDIAFGGHAPAVDHGTQRVAERPAERKPHERPPAGPDRDSHFSVRASHRDFGSQSHEPPELHRGNDSGRADEDAVDVVDHWLLNGDLRLEQRAVLDADRAVDLVLPPGPHRGVRSTDRGLDEHFDLEMHSERDAVCRRRWN